MFDRNSQEGTQSQKRRWMSGLLCGVLVLVLLVSVGFLAHEMSHDCDGGDCPICVCIRICEKTIRQIASGEFLSAAAFLSVAMAAVCALSYSVDRGSVTLITQKIRLNN